MKKKEIIELLESYEPEFEYSEREEEHDSRNPFTGETNFTVIFRTDASIGTRDIKHFEKWCEENGLRYDSNGDCEGQVSFMINEFVD